MRTRHFNERNKRPLDRLLPECVFMTRGQLGFFLKQATCQQVDSCPNSASSCYFKMPMKIFIGGIWRVCTAALLWRSLGRQRWAELQLERLSASHSASNLLQVKAKEKRSLAITVYYFAPCIIKHEPLKSILSCRFDQNESRIMTVRKQTEATFNAKPAGDGFLRIHFNNLLRIPQHWCQVRLNVTTTYWLDNSICVTIKSYVGFFIELNSNSSYVVGYLAIKDQLMNTKVICHPNLPLLEYNTSEGLLNTSAWSEKYWLW